MTKLTRPTEVRALLEKIGVRPGKSMGQNFLIDANILDILITIADLQPEDRVLEVGPGLGVLTEQLLAKAAHLTAVEKDVKLYSYVNERFAGQSKLKLLHGDALRMNLNEMLESGITKIISNLPYSIGSRFIVDALGCDTQPERMVFTLQREVALRLVAKPSCKDYGVMTVLAQLEHEVSIEKHIRPGSFHPEPEVLSSIMLFKRRETALAPIHDRRAFREFIKACFAQRRKKLINTLVRVASNQTSDEIQRNLDVLGIDGNLRPENLSVTQWGVLAERLGRN